MATRPYKNIEFIVQGSRGTQLTPVALALIEVDPAGMIAEAANHKLSTLTAVIRASQAQKAANVIALPVTPAPVVKALPRTKYPRTASGRTVSSVASELQKEDYKAGVVTTYAEARDFVLDNLDQF